MKYHNLKIYYLAKEIAVDVYKFTDSFPKKETFGLCGQMTRAAVSIASNIAESTSRAGLREQLHFIEFAYGSLMEASCQAEIALELRYLTPAQTEEFLAKANNLAIRISNYANALKGVPTAL